MRKVLFAILAVVLLIIGGLVIYKGFSIGKTGNIKVWGIKQIIAKDQELESLADDLNTLSTTSFDNAMSKLNDSGETMQAAKKEYEEQAVLISNSKYYMQTEKYKIDFLWTRIGNYAKDNKVTPKMDVVSGSTKGVYNLVITAVGKYQKVADFIYAIENDSRLGFKIEDFSMTQYTAGENSDLVQGKFTCKEIRIDIKSIDGEGSTSAKSNTTEDSTKSNTNTNTTNNATTNENNTTNTTSTNTTNETNTSTTENTTNAVNTNNTTDMGETANTTTT